MCTMNQLCLLPKSMLLLRWPTLSHSNYCKWPHSLCSLGKKNLGATKPPHPNLLQGLNYTLNFENSLLGGAGEVGRNQFKLAYFQCAICFLWELQSIHTLLFMQYHQVKTSVSLVNFQTGYQACFNVSTPL